MTALALCFSATMMSACSLGDSSSAVVADTITLADGWVALPPPDADRTAGYLTISNGFDGPVKVVGASTQAFGRVELHTMAENDGVMQMRPVDGFTVEAGKSLKLGAGGDHLMLLYPRDPLSTGQALEFTIAMRDPSGALVKQKTSFQVRAR